MRTLLLLLIFATACQAQTIQLHGWLQTTDKSTLDTAYNWIIANSTNSTGNVDKYIYIPAGGSTATAYCMMGILRNFTFANKNMADKIGSYLDGVSKTKIKGFDVGIYDYDTNKILKRCVYP